MRIASFVITAALATGLSGTAFAQTTNQPAPTAPTGTYGSDQVDGWFASAYLGSTFGGGGSSFFDNLDIDRGNGAGLNLGGEIGYAWNGTIGAEFMVNHSPNFEVEDVLFQRRPSVNSYMANILAAVPIGDVGNFRPFVSGGIGAVQLHSTIFTIDPSTTLVDINSLDTESLSHSQFGWNLGGGFMAFNGAWGLRGDVRYFRATTDDTLNDNTLRGALLQRQLSGLSYWNANFGIAFKW